MMQYDVAALCAAVGGTVLQSSDAVVSAVTTDSRAVAEGALFIPLTGEKFDGHDYIPAALAAGAAGCFTAKRPETMAEGKFYILVEDTLLALKALAGYHRGQFAIPMVQITGSAGKTTTKEMVAAVLSQRYDTLKTEANFNNAIGTPQTLLRLAPHHEAAVIETGMNHFGEIRYLGQMVRPTIAVITNIGDAHVENLGGTRQGILQAKCEIFENLSENGLVVLNGDDELLRGLELPFTTVLCGKGEHCHVRVGDIRQRGVEGTDCTITTEKNRYAVHIPSPGSFMIYPAAMAVAVGEHLGLTAQEMMDGVAAYTSVGSRMRLVRRGSRLVIDDCYNANPQAMAEALHLLSRAERTHRVAVLGDMGELGALSHSAHRTVGELTAQLQLSAVVAIGEQAQAIAEGNDRAQWFPTIEAALPTIQSLFRDDTAMLVKASHFMAFEKIVKILEDEKIW